MSVNTIFFGSDGPLRSGWRFAIFVFGLISLYLILGTAVFALLSLLNVSVAPGTPQFFVVNGQVILTIALALGWFCGKFLEGLPFDSLGASFKHYWIRNLFFGLAGGVATFSLAIGAGVVLGGLTFTMNSADSRSIIRTLFLTFIVFAVGAAWEEAVFRGYLLQTFVRSGLALPAIVFTSSIFGAIHLSNLNANWISSLNTTIAGIWFSLAYLKTRDLWFPTGLHLAWNWTQGSIFGVEVSGLKEIVESPLMRETDLGPAWLTGGDYGIEGGIITTIALMISTIAIYFIPIRKPVEAVDDPASENEIP